MKMLWFVIYMVAGIVAGSLLLYPFIRLFADSSLLNLIPFIVIMLPILTFVWFYITGDSFYEDLNEDDAYAITEKYEYEKKRLSPDEIIKSRYAKGKITDIEYAGRMSRL